MSLMTVLEQAQGGRLFAQVASSLDLGADETRAFMHKLCPPIAERLRARAAADEELFQSLLDLIEDGTQLSPLEDPEGLTGPEAIADGNAILEDVYGSRNAAMVALRAAGEAIPERELAKLAPISATAVVAALAAANRPMALAAAAAPARSRSAGEGFVSALVSAIIAGIVAALAKRFTTPRRRRTSSYTRTRTRRRTAARTSTARRRTTTASVEDVFRDILGNLGK
jgi:hypothetical protein